MRRRHILFHVRIWLALALLLPAILLASLFARQDRPAEAPRRIAPP